MTAFIHRWASWTGGGVRVDGAPAAKGGPLGDWVEAPRLGDVHRRLRRPFGIAAQLVTLASTIVDGADLRRCGVVLGSATGCADVDGEFQNELTERGPAFGSPSRFVYTLPTAFAAEVAIAFGFHGPCITVQAGAASGLNAVIQGAEWIDSDEVDVCLCGSFEPDALGLVMLKKHGRFALRGENQFTAGTVTAHDGLFDLLTWTAVGQEGTRTFTAQDPLGFRSEVRLSREPLSNANERGE